MLILVNHDLVIYNFRKELVQKLIEEGYEVYVSSPKGNRIEELITMGCRFIEVENINRHGKNPFTELKLLKEYKKLMRQIKPRCVLTYTIKPNIFGALATQKYNISCLSNITGLGTAVEKKGVLQLITTNLYKSAFKKIDTVFFQNTENMNFFIKKNISNKNNYVLLPGSGVNLSEFQLMEYPKNDKIKFVFISRIMKEKGIDLYLEAAEKLTKKYENLEFHICGFCEEDYEEKLADYVEKEIIVYHGMVNDVKEIIKESHCTVHPTYYPEGLSNVLLESSACGRPIITTNRSGCREVVNQEKNGYLVKENDIVSLLTQLEKFIQLPYEEKRTQGIEGRKFVESYFDREIVIEEYLKKIEGVIK
ncbi:glycosyltransferase family 4 protein [Vagococcus fluvialis]|uniref:glycosyltransferase family 4 protein n=1 Tax=Vagococcus fluvialis TaxID=2738 RepID=UPI003D099EA4